MYNLKIHFLHHQMKETIVILEGGNISHPR